MNRYIWCYVAVRGNQSTPWLASALEPMSRRDLTARRFVPQFPVFSLCASNGVANPDPRLPIKSDRKKRCSTAVASHSERPMRIDERISLQARVTDVWRVRGRFLPSALNAGLYDVCVIVVVGTELGS